ncbi:MAG TPA: hypothetical protein VD996_12210 [Chitinophagaceae bacterium]|nr:hypothetical protein [Chitinophagaceae bacterium]
MTTHPTTLLKVILAAACLLLVTGLCLFYIDHAYRFIEFVSRMACQAIAGTSQYLHITPLH